MRPHITVPVSSAFISAPTETATIEPDGALPHELNCVAFTPWQPPTSDQGWAAVEGQAEIDEPPFEFPPALRSASGGSHCVARFPLSRLAPVRPGGSL